MPRVIRKEEFRIKVRPRRAGDFGVAFVSGEKRTERETMKLCEEIASRIRKECSDLLPTFACSTTRGVDIEYDTEEYCEFCGSIWTEEDSKYNMGCCAMDEKNAPPETPRLEIVKGADEDLTH